MTLNYKYFVSNLIFTNSLKKELNILIVGDHPIIASAYKKIFLENSNYRINSQIAQSYSEALFAFSACKFDIVFVDTELSSSNDDLHLTGEEMTLAVKNKFPQTKIILELSANKARLFSILKSVPHDGVLIKKDVTPNAINQATDQVLSGITYYSITTNALKMEAENRAFALDDLDLKILQNLSRGVRTKNLSKFVPLSLSAIEKRKSRLKDFFNVKSDESLLETVKKEGFV